ncbi:MAG: hypothetical protein DYH03_19045 [Nitrospira sp. NTP1]|nr:hypothetical protein [Nitrospira sp. NTP1]
MVGASVLALSLLMAVAGIGLAQVVGEEAELDRLRAKAEDAMGNDDAEGAAMNMGRAALMAAQLGKRQTEPALRQVFKATEHLYRSQEHGAGTATCAGHPRGIGADRHTNYRFFQTPRHPANSRRLGHRAIVNAG